MPAFARKRDDNEPEIVQVLKRAGAVVVKLPGFGMPDLLVGFGGLTFLLEVKVSSTKAGHAHKRTDRSLVGHGELTEFQVEWWTKWTGAPIMIVHTPEEALLAIGAPPLSALPPPPPKARKRRGKPPAPNQMAMTVEDRAHNFAREALDKFLTGHDAKEV
jgi:Holliday junction resolvase